MNKRSLLLLVFSFGLTHLTANQDKSNLIQTCKNSITYLSSIENLSVFKGLEERAMNRLIKARTKTEANLEKLKQDQLERATRFYESLAKCYKKVSTTISHKMAQHERAAAITKTMGELQLEVDFTNPEQSTAYAKMSALLLIGDMMTYHYQKSKNFNTEKFLDNQYLEAIATKAIVLSDIKQAIAEKSVTLVLVEKIKANSRTDRSELNNQKGILKKDLKTLKGDLDSLRTMVAIGDPFLHTALRNPWTYAADSKCRCHRNSCCCNGKKITW